MHNYPPTVVLRHRKENLKKCSLRYLEQRRDFIFYRYPLNELPPLPGYVMLTLDAPPLGVEDRACGLLLIDATWRYAQKMVQYVDAEIVIEKRSLPAHFQTAYPRVQNDCSDPKRGLASIEAIYLAYLMMGRETTGLLDHYHWKEAFLQKNF